MADACSGPPLVLLVDDDEDFLDVNAQALRAAGYDVLCASDSAEALAHLEARRPAVIVTDLMMDALDAGFSLARKLKEDPAYRAIRVLVVTSASSRMGFDFAPRSDAELEAMNADAFLQKPVRPAALVEKVSALAAHVGH